MEHKAFAFDWSRFEFDLYPVLVDALTADDPAGLVAFIDRHRAELTDPYEGTPLPADWRDMLQSRDAHEYGDYALTRYYDPTDCWGVGYEWSRLSDELPGPAANALLGLTGGPPENMFDPGRYGSYFRNPWQVEEACTLLEPHSRPELSRYLSLLKRCVSDRRGAYITF
jgi:hypothetical protein